MKAVRLFALGDARVAEAADPVAGPGECVVRPLVSGLCGSDIHVFRHGVMVRDLPVTMGHEFVGEVVDLGPDGTPGSAYRAGGEPLRVGSRVVVEPLLPCTACPQCRRGHPNLCADWSHLGMRRDGCWADYVSVPLARVVPIEPRLDVRDAALVEPLACALNFVDKAELGPGRSALVLGAGPAGLLTMMAARAAGAAPVIVSEPHPLRRTLALALGADASVDPLTEDLRAVCDELTMGLGVDAAIEVSGSTAAVAQAVELAPPGATVVLAGICGQPAPAISGDDVVLKELTIRGGLASQWHFGRAMWLMASGAIDVRPLVSEERPWQEAAQAMDDLGSRPDLCKVLLTHDGIPVARA